MSLSLSQKYVHLVFYLALILNVYKFYPMARYFLGYENHYYVFPWQGSQGQISRSSGLWLICHLFIALNHINYVAQKISPTIVKLVPTDEINDGLSKLLFDVVILINMWNFGEASYSLSIAINGGLLLLSRYVSNCANLTFYYCVITLPVVFEAGFVVKALLGF